MKWIKWLYPGLNLKRWLFLFGLGTVLSCVGVTLIFNYQFVGLIEALVFNFISYVGGEFYQSTITALGLFTSLWAFSLCVMAVPVSSRRSSVPSCPEKRNPCGN